MNLSIIFCPWLYLNGFRPWDHTNLVLNSIKKVKIGSLLSLMRMFPESNGTKFWSHSFHLQNSGILRNIMDQKGDPIKTNLHIFQIQKWISKTVRAQKIDEKNWGHLSIFFFSFLSYGPSIAENSVFLANLCWPEQEI